MHALQQGLRLRQIGIGQQDRELVAAQPPQPVAGAQLHGDHVGEVAQELVAHRMPKGVVDQLEVIQVDEAQRMAELRRLRRLDQAQQPAFDLAAVDQAGQGIVARMEGDFIGQLVRMRDVFDHRQHQGRLLRAGLHQRRAPAPPHHPAVGAQQAPLARLQQCRPVDQAAAVQRDVVRMQHLGQRAGLQFLRPVAQDVGHRGIGIEHAAAQVELDHAQRRLLKRGAEAAFVREQIIADAAHRQHAGDQHQQQGRQAADHHHIVQQPRTADQQRLELRGIAAHAAVEQVQLVAQGLQRARIRPAGGLHGRGPVGQGAQLQQVGVGVFPHRDGIAQIRKDMAVAIQPHHLRHVLTGIAAGGQPGMDRSPVDHRLLDCLACRAVAERHFQRAAGGLQVGRIAAAQVALQPVHRLLLGIGPVALADDPGHCPGLNLDHQRREHRHADGHADQQGQGKRQPAAHQVHGPPTALAARHLRHCHPRSHCRCPMRFRRPVGA